MQENNFLTPFCEYSKIAYIDLKNNTISDVCNIHFRKLPDLVDINLKLNRIRIVNRFVFSQNKKLTHINLSHNRIATFALDINLLPSLVYLDLGHNYITLLNQSRFKNYVKQGNETGVKRLVLSNNSLACTCSMRWLSYVEEVDIIYIKHLNTDVCVTCLLNMSCKEVGNFKSKEECDLG